MAKNTKSKTTKTASKKKAAKPSASSATAAAAAVDIGLNEANRKKIADGLSNVLADSFTLYLKTHQFHWNVRGPMFNSLHLMFETQYTEQWAALDETAERIRALGFNAPGTYAQFIRLSTIKDEQVHDTGDWESMVAQLVLGNEAVCRVCRATLDVASKAGDDPTVDLMTQRLTVHEKNAWMLRSLLQ